MRDDKETSIRHVTVFGAIILLTITQVLSKQTFIMYTDRPIHLFAEVTFVPKIHS